MATNGKREDFNVVVSVRAFSKPLTLVIGRQVEVWRDMNLRNKLKLAIGILLLINLVSCNALPDKKSSVDTPSTATATSPESPTAEVNQNWVIVTRKQAEEIASWLGGSGGFWTPSADDIFKLEEGLAEYLSQNSSYFYRQPPVWERIDEYQRQYIGLERGGRQIIYGNFFCNNLV